MNDPGVLLIKLGGPSIEPEPRNGYLFGPTEILRRPTLACLIAAIVSSWATLEAQLGACLGVAMNADHRSAIAMLSKVQTATAKNQMLRAVGKASLDAAQIAKLEDLLKRFENAAKKRNPVAHGIWGVSGAYPNSLIWAPPESVSNPIIGLAEALMAGKQDEFLEKQKSKFEPFDEARLISIIEEINALIESLLLFTHELKISQFVARS